MGGDLNEVRYINERQGCTIRDRGMKDLSRFKEDMELIDMQLLGRNFTWSNTQEGGKWSRIDGFLVDQEWLDKYKIKQWGLPRSFSHHCPILLMEDDIGIGVPNPSNFSMLGSPILFLTAFKLLKVLGGKQG